MTTVPMPLFTKVDRSVDGSTLADAAELRYNGYIDPSGNLNIRPGEVLAIDTASRCDGIFYWRDRECFVCVDADVNGQGVVSIRTIDGQLLSTVSTAATKIPASIGPAGLAPPIVFCIDQPSSNVYMVNGGKIYYVSAAGVVTEMADADAPTIVTHIAFLDSYIIAMDGSAPGRVMWSDVSNPTSWSALNFATAEASPDALKALFVVQRQILLLGTVSMEIWEDDGQSPFSRIPGGLIEIGCIARYSPIRRDDSLFWLDNTRRFVQFAGTGVKRISSPYDREIDTFSVVSDCIGALMMKNGCEFLVWNFPTQKRTIVYNITGDEWSEWGVWDPASRAWLPYDMRGISAKATDGSVFVAKDAARSIARVSSDSLTDIAAAGGSRIFKMLHRTGHIDNGAARRKVLETLSFRAKRGCAAVGATSAKLMVRWRDDGRSEWSNIREISLGLIGDTGHHVTLRRLGTYRSRQFEFSVTDGVPVVLSSGEADITPLAR